MTGTFFPDTEYIRRHNTFCLFSVLIFILLAELLDPTQNVDGFSLNFQKKYAVGH